jgi:hypothetical protein
MARLQIEQIAAPNQSAAASLLAGAGQSFDRGMSAASSLLDKYQQGQESRGDQEILADIAGLNSEEELGAYLQSGALEGKNLSADMRQNVLGLRDNIIGYGQSRASVLGTEADTRGTNARTADTYATTAINQAAEGRRVDEAAYTTLRRNEQSGVASDYASALANAQQFGTGGAFSAAIDSTESGGASDQYDTTLGHANRNNGVRVSQMTLGQASEYSQGEYAQQSMAWKRDNDHGDPSVPSTPMGKFQIVGRTLRTVMTDLDLPSDIQFSGPVQEQLGTYLGQNRVIGKSQEAARAGLRSEWAGFADKTDGELDVMIEELRNSPRVTRDSVIAAGTAQARDPNATPQGAVTQNAPMSQAGQDLMSAVAQGTTFTMDDVNAMFTGLNAAQDRGQGQIDTAETSRVENVAAQTTIDALQDPNNLTPGAVAGANFGNAAISPSDQLAAAGQARAVAEQNVDILNPATTLDPLVQAQAESDARTRQRGVAALPQTALLATAERYSGDAVGGLIGDLGVGADGEDPQTYVFGLFGENADANQLRVHIRDIAEQAGVTQEMAAAAMADEFTRDPWGINRDSKRFNPDDVVAYLDQTVGPEGMQAYEGALVAEQTANGRSEAQQLQISNLESQLIKTTGDPARREQIQNQINQLTDQTLGGSTPQEATRKLEDYVRSQSGMAARLREARNLLTNNPESPEAFRAISDLETEIQRDPNISDREKQLLISTLRG